jgi:hypothetical protein
MSTIVAKNHVDVIRYFGNSTWSMGIWLFNQQAICFTLEDAHRTEKLKGKTRIPAGLYMLELKPIGSSRFDSKAWNMPPLRYYGMLRLRAVPGFEEILIHPGNSDADTEGCLLVGCGANLVAGQVLGSAPAYLKVYQPIADVLKKGEPVSILIQDKDRPADVSALVA